MKTRDTLFKRIAAARTKQDKFTLARRGYLPTEIHLMAENVTTFPRLRRQAITREQKAVVAPYIEQVKSRFTEMFFTALEKDNPEPFHELLAAMARVRGERARRGGPEPTKRRAGRIQRLALLHLSEEDLATIKSVSSRLAEWGVAFSDQSAVRKLAKELNLKIGRKRR
jgi:hypothetical protein